MCEIGTLSIKQGLDGYARGEDAPLSLATPVARFARPTSARPPASLGWVHRVRDHGGVLFIDLRDHYGMTQVVADPDSAAFKLAEKVRSEWVIRVDGKVRDRPAGTVNAELPTGEIELFATEIEVLSEAKELPLPVFGEPDYPEDIRLTYRFLDLRRETLHKVIMNRLAITKAIRARMHDAGFNEFPTPILTASSPEGARDFLVPSRIHAGKFYALPQAPQQYKQLLMMSGFDRYFQIAPCFRDEDPRADRLPGEFYQLDVEMSFVEQDDVFATMEPVVTGLFEEFAAATGKAMKVDNGWPRIPYDTAIQKYGSDKPDLRNPIEMQDVTEHFRGSRFQSFRRHDREGPEGARLGDPRAERRLTRLLRPHERLGPEGRPAGPWLHHVAPGRRRRRRRPHRQECRRRPRGRDLQADGTRHRRRLLLHRRRSGQVLQIRRPRPRRDRPRAETDRREPLRLCLDRRLPVL